MEGITIEFEYDEKQLMRVHRALESVGKSAHYYIRVGEGMRMLAAGYIELLRQNITSQAFVSTWGIRARRYHPRYKTWKDEMEKGSRFWILYGDLLANLRSFRISEGWMGGVPSYVKDRGGKSWFGKGEKGERKTVAMYGTVLEEGGNFKYRKGGRHPARPMFAPTLLQFTYAKSVGTAGNAWRIGDEILKRIGARWK